MAMTKSDSKTDLSSQVKRLVVPQLEGPKFLDGTLQSPVWDSAAKVDVLSAHASSEEPYSNSTEAYAFHDGKYLYLGWKCRDTDISEMLLQRKRYRDHFCEWEHAQVCLDVALEHKKRNIWAFQVDPYGDFFRLQGGFACWSYLSRCGVESAARIWHDQGYWTAELRVLFSEVGIDLSRSNLVGFNIGRALRGKHLSWLAEPDGEVLTGWSFASLDVGDEAFTERSSKRIDILLKKADPDSLPDTPGRYRISNAQVGACLSGPHNRPTFWIGKSDVWDRRLITQNYKQITLKELTEAAFSDSEWSNPAHGYTARYMNSLRSGLHRKTPKLAEFHERITWYSVYNYPCPKPVGQVIIGLPFDENECIATSSESLSFQEYPNPTFAKGHNVITVQQGNRSIELKVYLRPRANVILVEGKCENMDGEEITLRVYRHRDVLQNGPAFNGQYHEGYCYMKDWPANKPLDGPSAGVDGDNIWVRQEFPAEQTFPDGLSMVLMGGVQGTEILDAGAQNMEPGLGTQLSRKPHPVYALRWVELFNKAPGSAATLRIKAADSFRAAFAVATTGDGPHPKAAAQKLIADAFALPSETLWQEYQEAPRSDYIDTSPYGSDIPVGSSCGPAKFCMDDIRPWHGAFTFDENISRYPFFYVSGTHGDLEGYYGLVERMLPLGRHYAREVFDCAGAAFVICHFPINMDRLMQSTAEWDFCMELTAAIMKPFWMHYLYSYDKRFLEERAYPVLKAGAEFYADFLTLEDDGLYHVIPTGSPEHFGINRNFMLNKDANAALTMAKYHLNAAAQAAGVLGVDTEQARHWQKIASNMAPYPVAESRRGRVFVDTIGAPYMPTQYNEAAHLAAVIWGDDIDMDSSPELVDIARRTAEDYIEGGLACTKSPRWASYGFHALFRLGVCWEEAMKTVKELSPSDVGNSLEQEQTCSRHIAIEQFLQSHKNVIRVFPAVAPDYSGRFENYRAQGAFGVSAEMNRGKITELKIVSDVGNRCCLARPWPGEVCVRNTKSGAEVPLETSEKHLKFDTAPGAEYEAVRLS